VILEQCTKGKITIPEDEGKVGPPMLKHENSRRMRTDKKVGKRKK